MESVVEWLEKQTRTQEWHSLKREDIIEKANQMFKEQIELAHIDGGKNRRTSVEYYKQTFKSEKEENYPCPSCQGGGCPYCSGYGTIPK